MNDRSSLSEPDRQRLDQFMTLTFRSRVQRYELARDGISSPLQADLDERGFNWWMQKPGIQQCWQEYRALYPREFQDYVDRAIGQGEPTP
jgi:hypothetical protein